MGRPAGRYVASVAVTVDWAEALEREGGALGDAAGRDLGAAVPAAPGWDTADLVRHVGLLHTRASVILRTGTMERPSRANGMLPDPPAEGLLDWYRTGLAGAAADVRSIDDPERPVYAFAPQHQRAGFWPRRITQETTVHRVDAEQAVGIPVGPIPPALAIDGVDELFSVFVPRFGGDRSPGDGRTVHLHATDGEGEWLIRFDQGEVVVEAGHAKGDAAVRGPAGDLLLWLWGRLPLDRLEVFGDRGAADALRAVTTF
jgi:uncharacterized protein (TIGR03083 family)